MTKREGLLVYGKSSSSAQPILEPDAGQVLHSGYNADDHQSRKIGNTEIRCFALEYRAVIALGAPKPHCLVKGCSFNDGTFDNAVSTRWLAIIASRNFFQEYLTTPAQRLV
ncbi:hypothetical protein PV05_02056 [Exophiala xenobiotica]|uniref:Uncharacterized protein n=1 Tax=Exophiala xenobiotica TaxID=348802 RepID=A0A0D2DI98_9EURO|nr:uncharacterized protein PV05_02056 [Exophiala xenobiotica]KIW62002.1 hypothetical protein PV05_02056 [Exophiala xenobiotica]